MSKKTSVKFTIIKALENLSSRDLKQFRTMLCDRKEEPRVSRRAVEDADEMDLADLLVKVCTEAKAAKLTIEIFNELGFKEQAEKLERDTASVEGGSESRSKYMTGGQHFIDKHRISLIQRISTVAPILDHLLNNGVISHENYSDINSQSTSYRKMRELMELGSIRCSNRGKDFLFEALMESERFLMEELMEGS